MAEEEDRQGKVPTLDINTSPSDDEVRLCEHGSPERISGVEISDEDREEGSGSRRNSDDEFEFPCMIQDPAIAAQIRVYPVFGRSLISSPYDTEQADSPAVRLPLRKLFIEERNSSIGSTSTSSSTAETVELEGVPAESYCLWNPGSVPQSPAKYKSGSTGSIVKWKKISDLVLGRSHSDGKEKFVFLAASSRGNTDVIKEEREREKREKEKKNNKNKKKNNKFMSTTEVDTITAHRILYGGNNKTGTTTNGPTTATSTAATRKSFLPYKQDLIGFFAGVNGISRTHHPY